jgi:hypothetical protein
MGNAGKVAIVGGIFVAVFVASQALFVLGRPQSPEEAQAQLEKQVASLKETLPQKVHPMVTWFDVEAEDHTIVYKYKVEASYTMLSRKEADMKEQLQGSWAGWAATMMLPSGVKAKCKIYDENKTYVFTLDLN